MKNHIAVLAAAGTLGAAFLMGGCGQKSDQSADVSDKKMPPLGIVGTGADTSKVSPSSGHPSSSPR